ncbi:MAG: hypothetical protein EA379_12115 [Phycisphaerales bacterium]|nr:MAG: hypothetical protein EA379_12115 [Phycisphaerales bacterium]
MQHHHTPRIGRGFAAAALVCFAGAALANDPEIIFTKIATHPSSIVPGAVDPNGDPVNTNWRALERIIVSPDGSRWILKGRTQQATLEENIMLLGSDADLSTVNFAQEGLPIPDGVAGEVYDFFGSGLGRFNLNNQFAYSARARGGVNSVFQKVIVYSGGLVPTPADFEIVTQMGDPYTGLIDSPPNPSGDELVGNSIGSIHILDNGTVGAHDATIQNINSLRRPALFYDNDSFLQRGVDTVLGLDGVTVFLVTNLSGNTFYTTPDGQRWIALGTIDTGSTANNSVLLLNGQVVLQQGSEIGTTGVIVNAIFTANIASSGDWYARGSIAGGGVWAVVNGALVARTGSPIHDGATETWGTSFLSFDGNANGEWVLVGTTDNPDPALDTVMVLNDERVLVREGDQVDLPGFADDVFIGRGNPAVAAFSANETVLTNDGIVYFIASIHDGAGNDYNSTPAFATPQAFFRLDTNPAVACPGDFNGDNVVDFADLSEVLGDFGGAYDFNDLSLVLSNFGADCN